MKDEQNSFNFFFIFDFVFFLFFFWNRFELHKCSNVFPNRWNFCLQRRFSLFCSSFCLISFCSLTMCVKFDFRHRWIVCFLWHERIRKTHFFNVDIFARNRIPIHFDFVSFDSAFPKAEFLFWCFSLFRFFFFFSLCRCWATWIEKTFLLAVYCNGISCFVVFSPHHIKHILEENFAKKWRRRSSAHWCRVFLALSRKHSCTIFYGLCNAIHTFWEIVLIFLWFAYLHLNRLSKRALMKIKQLCRFKSVELTP